MDPKTIGDIIAIVSPTITLILTLVTILNNIEKSTTPLDTPFIKILTIKRHPYSIENILKSFKRSSTLSDKILIINSAILLAFISVKIFFPTIWDRNNISFLIGGLISIISVFLSVLFFDLFPAEKDYLNREFTSFASVDIIIEADFQYLFDKSINALKSMNLKISEVELGDNKGNIQALRIRQINIFSTTISVTVTVQKIENSESSFSVKLAFFKDLNEPYTDANERSKITNIFIDRLISKPTKA